MACLTTFSVLAAVTKAHAQGSLTPPGAPAPGFKTLQQVEPRGDVQRLPGDPLSLYIISAPGSYYLTANVVGAPGMQGISIRASNVTLDLNGFAVLGAPGSLDGIAVMGPQNNVEIRSGNIEGWSGDGVDSSMMATDCRFVNLRSCSNDGNGFNLGPRSVVTECHAATNRMNGIRISSGIVKHCITTGNGSAANPPVVGSHGIYVIGGPVGPNPGGDIVKDCVSDYNVLDGINVAMALPGKAAIISDCVTKCNLDDGIEVFNHCVVRGNKCLNNMLTGIHVVGTGTGNRIEDNHVAIHPNGYLLDPMTVANLVIKNSSQGNAVGYLAPAGNHVAAITAFPGIGFVGATAWTNFDY
jgi:parallel beta-helix repeat protein